MAILGIRICRYLRILHSVECPVAVIYGCADRLELLPERDVDV